MRPSKAVIILILSEVAESEIIERVIDNGICGRLVLRGESSLESNLKIDEEFSISLCESSEPSTNQWKGPEESIGGSDKKIIYAALQNKDLIEAAISYAVSHAHFLTLIFNNLLPVPAKPDGAPLQSYEFSNCDRIEEPLIRSVFYVDFEPGYTRRDWLRTLKDIHQIGGNNLILCEKHHLELLTRLGIKAKYGS